MKSLLTLLFKQFLQEDREVGVALRESELLAYLATFLVVACKVDVCLRCV